MDHTTFSKRHGFAPGPSEIVVRHDAPSDLRHFVVEFAYECGLRPGPIRTIVCDELMTRPDENNWSEYPNIDSEVRMLVDHCRWYHVYDIAEAIHQVLKHRDAREGGDSPKAPAFREKLNGFMVRKGIGWQLTESGLEVRGPEAFEAAVRPVVAQLEDAGLATAASEMHEALLDLGRRPNPDVTGAVQHAMAAAECVARKVTGSKATLGQIIQAHPDLLPAPLNKAVEKIWGYSSEMARHLLEGRKVGYPEAQLVVQLAGAVINYIERSLDEEDPVGA